MLLAATALVVGAASGVTGSTARANAGRRAVATGRVEVTLALRPRHPALLSRLAAASSAARPLPAGLVRALFLPTGAQVARVRAAMRRDGLTLESGRGLDLTFTGSAAAAGRAFSAPLVETRRVDGSRVLRPLARPVAPAAIAPMVQDIEGLDTQTRLHPLGLESHGRVPSPSCGGPASTGGYLPAQLGSFGGYGQSRLIREGFDGAGERVAVIALSNYLPSDVAAYQACFGLEVPVTDVPVNGGTAVRTGSDEVELDIETVLSSAPGLDGLDVYILKPTATMAQAVNAVVAGAPGNGVHVITDSWGVCEPALPPARAAATNAALQLAAVQGITFLAASGDSGLFDCFGFHVRAVDDPAAQPFATGVGGTKLRLAVSGDRHEVVWNDRFGAGGGGLSRFWLRPSWQAGAGVVNGLSNGMREVPDISLHAAVTPHGYPVYCTTAVCGGAGWTTFGGTSASAPLMAAIVADMNQYSRAHGGRRLGYANPFLYDRLANRPSDFRDITVGNNNPDGSGHYRATPFYDMASGIGSPRAVALAADLAAYRPVPPSPAETMMTVAPRRDRVLRYGHRIRLRGTLTTGGDPVAGARITVQVGDRLGIREFGVRTGPHGGWTLTLRRQLTRKAHWRAVYLGSVSLRPAISPSRTIYVIPPLTAKLDTHVVAAGGNFRFSGRTLGSLARRPIAAEVRRVGGHRWHRLGPTGVRITGAYDRVFQILRPGHYRLRWHYHGGTRGQWLSAVSPSRRLLVL
jgi:kumamolisin